MCSIVLFIVCTLECRPGKMNHCTYSTHNLQLHTCTCNFFSLLPHSPKLNEHLGNMHPLKNLFTSCVDHPTCPSLVYFVDLIRMVRWSKVKCILLKVGRHEFLKDVSHRLTILLKFPFMLPPFCHKSYRILIPTVNTITLQT